MADPSWPDLVHPFDSEIDTPLPVPEESVHMMLGSKASWVQPQVGPRLARGAGVLDLRSHGC